jgi:TPR repeat protein
MTRLYLRSSVAAGHPSRKGDGLEKRLLEAAEGGDAGAQCNLGILYGNGLDDNGHMVKANRPQAVKWLLAAAEQGLHRAQSTLAEAYADGPDVLGGSCWRQWACAAYICTALDPGTIASPRI